ncbi:hypothetical protein [Lacimicrobium alkaliphilum]|uniref:Uncharacterized protein n=1 Tax=Lacimicrobium alkaliphilum TaxID=1526571 RepID=A0ABQ1R698_9ALTE|nr:hypothetical protein [Lacimicrobium alkaliphilum]GGD59616.1 hypothetical protein GCM10011357_13660 [Lacimicrobium alkaliphilum]
MGHLDVTKNNQTALFEQVEKSRLFFITNQRNLMSFLGAGMVVPAKSQFRYKKDSRELFNGAVPLWKARIPNISKTFPHIDQDRAVVIEFDFTHLETFLENGRILDQEAVVVMNAPLPISAIKSIYLKSQQAIDDFLLRLTDDVIADPALFEVLDDASTIDTINVESDYEIKDLEDPLKVINFVDRFGGAVMSLNLLSNSNSSQVDYATLLLLVCVEHWGFGNTKSVDPEKIPSIPTDDREIIKALLDILSNTYPERGFDPDNVLTEIEKKLRPLRPEYREGVSRWLDFCKKVVNSEKDVPELNDKGDIIKRGVLLFLLRPDLERLRSAPDSSINPGSSVFLVANFLSGFFTGMFRIGSEYKGSFSQYSQFCQSLLDSFWCIRNRHFESVHESDAIYGASQILKINGITLFSQKVEKNLSLARVQSIARSTRYDMQYDYKEHRLSYEMTLDKGRKRKVYIELVKPLIGGSEVIRFISPCQDLKGSKRKRVLTKNKVLDLLLRNSRDDMYCSFAVSDSMEAIVVEATQIVRTMDDDEFELLLNHVATVADEYEHE